MIAHSVFFYFFSVIAIFSSLMVITSRSTVNSVFFLFLDFWSVAESYVLLQGLLIILRHRAPPPTAIRKHCDKKSSIANQYLTMTTTGNLIFWPSPPPPGPPEPPPGPPEPQQGLPGPPFGWSWWSWRWFWWSWGWFWWSWWGKTKRKTKQDKLKNTV